MRKLALFLLLMTVACKSQQVNSDVIPASPGLNMGHTNQRWNGFFNTIDIQNCLQSGQPCFTKTTFQANGVNTSDQSIFNLVQGPNCTITNTGGGNLSINCAGGGPTIQANGVNSSSQTFLNLVPGANCTLTDLGGGSLQYNCAGGGAGNPSSPVGSLQGNSAGFFGGIPNTTVNFVTGQINTATLIPSCLGRSPAFFCYVDGLIFSNAQAVADSFENYPTNNGQRTGVVQQFLPELMTSNPWPPNFAPEWRLNAGLKGSICDSTNINCIVLETPMILLPGSAIVGFGRVQTTGTVELSQGSTIVTGNNWPPPLGVPSVSAPTCSATGGSLTNGNYFIEIRTVRNVQTHAGGTVVSGPSMYISEFTVNCSGGGSAQSISVTSPAAVGDIIAGNDFRAKDYQVAASTVSGGEQIQARDTTNMACTAGTVSTFNGVNYGCAMGSTATIKTIQTGTRFFEDTDHSNDMFYIAPGQTVSFSTQMTGVTINCGPIGSASGFNVPNWAINNLSGEEMTGMNPIGMEIDGPCGGYSNGSATPPNSGTGPTGGTATGFSGGWIYENTKTPNGGIEHMQLANAPSAASATAPFYPIYLDGRPDGQGGAAGIPRFLRDLTVNPKSGTYSPAAIYVQGSRARVHISDIHIESNNAASNTIGIQCDNGAWCQIDGVEGQNTTSGTLIDATSTAGRVTVTGACAIGTATSLDGRCIGQGQNSSAATFRDETVTPNRVLRGFVGQAESGTAAALTSAYTNATATASTIFAFPVIANALYHFVCGGVYQGTVGGKFALTVTGPASPGSGSYQFREGINNAGNVITWHEFPVHGSAYPAAIGDVVALAANDLPWTLDYWFQNGANAGTFSIQGSTVAATTLTVEPGAKCEVRPW